MKLKEYYSYKKKFLIEEKATKEKSNGLLYIKSTSNNLFLALMTTKSKLLFLKSAGNYGFKTSRNRVSKQAFKVIFRELIKEIVSRKWSCLTIVYKGFRYRNFFLLDYLSQRGIKVNLVRNLIRLPYNGCRLKKYPRK